MDNNRVWREEDHTFIRQQWQGTPETLAEAIDLHLGTMITEYDELQVDIRELKHALSLPQLSVHQRELLLQELVSVRVTRRNLKNDFKRMLVRQTHVRNYIFNNENI